MIWHFLSNQKKSMPKKLNSSIVLCKQILSSLFFLSFVFASVALTISINTNIMSELHVNDTRRRDEFLSFWHRSTYRQCHFWRQFNDPLIGPIQTMCQNQTCHSIPFPNDFIPK